MVPVYIAGTGGGQAFGTAQGSDMILSEAVSAEKSGYS